jgi:coenzyme PQQ precursor peptide PqqA
MEPQAPSAFSAIAWQPSTFLPKGGTKPAFLEVVRSPTPLEAPMRWTKPEAEIVAVTMEVTAYVATL